MDENPEDAARALELSAATGADPTLVHGDLEETEKQIKANMTAEIIRKNSFLQDYINSHPLAPKISANDWGQLDKVSDALNRLWVRGQPRSPLELAQQERFTAAPQYYGGIAQAAIEGAYRSGGGLTAQHPMGQWLIDALGGPGSAGMNSLNRIIGGTLEGLVVDVPSMAAGALFGAARSTLHQTFGTDYDPEDIPAIVNDVLPALIGAHGAEVPLAEEQRLQTEKTNQFLTEGLKAGLPYILEGKEPPTNVHPLWDYLHGEQAKLDADNLDELVKESQKSQTRNLNPDFFADHFLRRATNASILVDADAVRKLYGDKVPEAGDNLLGWVKGIQDQLAVAAEDGGGHVSIPIADWAAHVDPEVAKALRDDIQFRPGGVTLNEAKELKAEPKAEETKPEEEAEQLDPDKQVVDSIRQQTRLQPPLAMAEREGIEDAPRGLREVEPLRGRTIVPENATEGGDVQIRTPLRIHTINSQATFALKDGIDLIDTKHLSTIPKLMYGFIGKKLQEAVGNTPVHIVDFESAAKIFHDFGEENPSFAAFYDPSGKQIIITREKVDMSDHAWASEVLLHEGSHALTHDAIYKYPEIRQLLTDLQNHVRTTLEESGMSDKVAQYSYNLTGPNEEFAAHEFLAGSYSRAGFQNVLASISIPKEIAERLRMSENTNTAWDAFKAIIRKAIERFVGKRPGHTVLEAMLRAGDAFDLAREELAKGKRGQEQREAAVEPIQKPTAAEAPRNLSEQIARLLGKGRGEKYLESMAKRDEEDAKFQADLADRRAREQQTAEWKENRKAMRTTVSEDIHRRPQIAADVFFRTGELYGEKIRKPHLSRKDVPSEFRDKIPADYLIDRGGIHPDAAAGFFGYKTGRAMLDDMVRLREQQEEAGLTPSAHLTSMIEAETDRRMVKTYGSLDQSILEEAKDHILGTSELDRLHEDMMALNAIHQGNDGEMTAAEQLRWNKAAIKARVKENVASGRYGNMGSLTSDHFVDLIGRLGKRIEDALQDEDFQGAFKISQQRLIAAHIAKEVKTLERAKARFDKAIKNWRKREPSGLLEEDATWIHQILFQIGQPPRRSIQDLEYQRGMVSRHATLREYYNEVNKANGTAEQNPDAMPVVQSLNIMEDLFSPNWRKQVEDMTPEEFMGVFGSLKSIDNWGRNNKKSLVKGNREDTNTIVSGLVERLKAAVNNVAAAMNTGDKSAARTVGTWLLNPETWFNRLDLGNRLGPFNQLIVRPITEGQHHLRTLEREFAAMWRDLGEPEGYRDTVVNDIFKDQDGDFIHMTRGNALAVLSNMGNRLQRAKLVLGWNLHTDVGAGETMIWNWLQRVGIGPEDLARAQKMGRIFERAFEESEKAYIETAGIAPARIDLGAMHTPWGVTEEWYHPLIPDPLRKSTALTADDMINESGFYRPSPTHGYTKLRTGAIYPIDLSYDSIPFKLKQILNDAAMRVPITEVNKIVYHDNFQTAFKKYYGPEYFSALDAWMKDTAGNRQWVPGNMKSLDMMINSLQRNLNTLLIGFNMGTVAKHAPTAAAFSMAEVGVRNFLSSLSHMIWELPGSQARWDFAMENSEELQNRMRNIHETLMVTHHDLFSNKTGVRRKIDSFRDTIEKYGHYPVGYTDLYSAVAMWDAEYRRLSEEQSDLTHGDKVYLANTAVRRTHGSSILSNRPSIMRNSTLWRMVTPFYNFFNNALQRNYELAWKAKLALQGRELPEMRGFAEEKFAAGPRHILPLIGGIMVYGVIPSLIEQMVDPLPEDKTEYKVTHWAKILTRAYSSMMPGVRDIITGIITHHDPSIGLFGTFGRDIGEPLKLNTYVKDPGQAILNANRAFGALTGMTVEHFGQAGKFTANVLAHKEHPKGMGDLFRGLWHGTLKPPRK